MGKDYERLRESAEAFIYVAMSRLDAQAFGSLMRLFGQSLTLGRRQYCSVVP
jgi:hypothetical protein